MKIKNFECPKSIRNYEKKNTWNVRPLVNESFVPSAQQTSVLYCRLSDFWGSPYVSIRSGSPATVQCSVSRDLKNWKFNFEPNPICWKKGFICSSANNLSRKKNEKSSTTGSGGHFQYDDISSLHTEITAFKLIMTTLVNISGAHSSSADFSSKVWSCQMICWLDFNWLVYLIMLAGKNTALLWLDEMFHK